MQPIFEPIKRACEIVGSQAALARAIGESPTFVGQWLRRERPVPVKACPKIERATNGMVLCEELFPDFEWDYLARRKRILKKTA